MCQLGDRVAQSIRPTVASARGRAAIRPPRLSLQGLSRHWAEPGVLLRRTTAHPPTPIDKTKSKKSKRNAKMLKNGSKIATRKNDSAPVRFPKEQRNLLPPIGTRLCKSKRP